MTCTYLPLSLRRLTLFYYNFWIYWAILLTLSLSWLFLTFKKSIYLFYIFWLLWLILLKVLLTKCDVLLFALVFELIKEWFRLRLELLELKKLDWDRRVSVVSDWGLGCFIGIFQKDEIGLMWIRWFGNEFDRFS
jgi:hypothetical protein